MQSDWPKFLEDTGTITESVLLDMLRSNKPTSEIGASEDLQHVAKWLGNSATEKFSVRQDIDNNSIIRCLREVDEPSTLREIIKTWLIMRLFNGRVMEPKTGLRLFRAEPFLEEDYVAATKLIEDDRARFGIVSNSAFLAAAANLGRGNIRAAYRHFDEMRRGYLAGEFVSHFTQGSLSTRPLEEFESAIAAGLKSHGDRFPIQLQTAEGFKARKPIALVGVDPIYHDRYAQRMVRSAKGVVNIHFHVCNPGEMKLIEADNVRYSFETRPDANAAYYASMRFLVLRQILDLYDVPVVTLDADSVFLGEVPWVFDLMEDFDIAVGHFQPQRGIMPWRFANAQVFVAAPNEGARAFLRYFELQFDHIMHQDGAVNWYVDQALLTSTIHLAREHDLPTRILVQPLSYLSRTRQSKIK